MNPAKTVPAPFAFSFEEAQRKRLHRWNCGAKEVFSGLMKDGTFDIAMFEAYTYCPGLGNWPNDANMCSNTGIEGYYPRLRYARSEGWINRSIVCLGFMSAHSNLNPGGWTKDSLKATILKYGGPRVYSQLRPFFLGMILGHIVPGGFFLLVDHFTGMVGNVIFWG